MIIIYFFYFTVNGNPHNDNNCNNVNNINNTQLGHWILGNNSINNFLKVKNFIDTYLPLKLQKWYFSFYCYYHIYSLYY